MRDASCERLRTAGARAGPSTAIWHWSSEACAFSLSESLPAQRLRTTSERASLSVVRAVRAAMFTLSVDAVASMPSARGLSKADRAGTKALKSAGVTVLSPRVAIARKRLRSAAATLS